MAHRLVAEPAPLLDGLNDSIILDVQGLKGGVYGMTLQGNFNGATFNLFAGDAPSDLSHEINVLDPVDGTWSQLAYTVAGFYHFENWSDYLRVQAVGDPNFVALRVWAPSR